MSNEYDISRAFKRIENDLIDSMMRNMKRHRVEEAELGIEWEQWQALQLQELERFRAENAQLFGDDFKEIQDKIDDMFWATYEDAQGAEEHRLTDRIKKGDFTPPIDKGSFFNLNEGKLQALLMATKADFARAEYAMLRRANDQYRKIIFDAMTYANVTNDYNKAVDMATKDFLRSGINCIVYKNGARHTVPDYARMALRTGNKRAYLMGEGNAHDRYGLHTVRVNKRPHACPKCVGFLGRLLIDDVYGGGSRAEATAMGIPTLSDAIGAGFLHPNCKDMYSVYIPGISRPAQPWTQEEISDIVGEYNQEQEIRHAEDMRDTYQRMAKYSLDLENQAIYQQRADDWQARVDELSAEPPTPAPMPVPQPTPQPTPQTTGFTDEEKQAIEWYVSGDGMWINQYLRGNMEGAVLSDTEQRLSNLLDSATSRTLEYDKLYRSVDASVIFEGLNETEVDQMVSHLMWGNDAYDKGAYSQGIKKRMEQELAKVKGKSLTEKGFMSTTVDEQIAIDFRDFTDARNPVVIELDTKGKKLKGADLTEFDIPEDPQQERLLARNTRYKITDIGVDTDADGVKYIKVKAEILDQGAEAVEEVAEVVQDAKTFDRNSITWSNSGSLVENSLKHNNVAYNEATEWGTIPSEKYIISRLCGGDKTKGSCASLAWSYIANKYQGLDVLDFRGGDSQAVFASSTQAMARLDGVKATFLKGRNVKTAKDLLKQVIAGKEYVLSTGRHASMVRLHNGKLQYLELQSPYNDNGWTDFGATTSEYTNTLRQRFGCISNPTDSILIEADTYSGSDEFRELMGYINTDGSKQKKGKSGSVK